MERKVLVKISAVLSIALGLLGAVWYVAALKKQQLVVAQPAVVMVLDSLLQQVLDAPANEGRGLMQRADSVYYSLSSPGITIACKRYDTKRAWFMERAFIADTALLYADSTLQLLQKAPVKEWYYQQYVEAVLNKGDILLYQGKYYDAFRCYYDGKQAINKVRDTCLYKSFVAAYSGRVAMVNYRRFKYREAIGWFKESVDNLYGCDKKLAAFAAMQGTLDNIALAYTRLQMTDSALYYYQAALHFIETHEQAYPDKTAFIEMAKAVIYGNEGDALLLKGDTAGARVLFTRSIVINSKEGYYNADAVITRIKLAEVYCWQHELQKAGEVMEEVRLREAIIPGDDTRARWLRLNWKYYHDKGQPALANAWLQRYFAFKDSVEVSRVALNEADFGKTYEALDHAYALKVLNEKYKLKTEYLLIAILAMVMAVGVVMVLLYARRLARKNLAHIHLQNQQLETAMAELELSNKNYSHLLKIVAHDLRNPIGAMGSIAALLANNSNSSREKNMLELIQTSSRQSLDMITDLMEINFSNERLAVTRKEFEMNQLVHQCVDLLSFKAREKGLQLLIKTEAFALVSADYYKIWRVINNLLMNAIKFSAVNGTVIINLVLKGERVQLSVQDSGQGIPEEIRDKVFDLFTEAKRPGTLGEQPYGMGLYISRQIMEAHDGSIWFECTEGRGTIFYITLPLSTT